MGSSRGQVRLRSDKCDSANVNAIEGQQRQMRSADGSMQAPAARGYPLKKRVPAGHESANRNSPIYFTNTRN